MSATIWVGYIYGSTAEKWVTLCRTEARKVTMVEDLFHPPKLSKPTFDDANEVVHFVRELPPAHCIFRVGSFSRLQDRHHAKYRDHFSSTEFKAGGYRWVLTVYPNGNKKENGDGHLSLYVRMVDKLGFGSSVSVALRFLIYDQIRDKYLTILDIREKRFQAIKNEWGIPKVLPLSSFADCSNGYLVKDCCVFGAEVLVINVENYASEVSVLKPTSNWEYTWKIDKYSELGSRSYSPVFTFEGWSWRLVLYPRGLHEAEENSLSLFLELHNSCRLSDGTKLFAEYSLCLKNQFKGSNHQTTFGTWFSSTCTSWGRTSFLPLEDVNSSLKGLMRDDCVIVEVKIEEMFLLKEMEKANIGSGVDC